MAMIRGHARLVLYDPAVGVAAENRVIRAWKPPLPGVREVFHAAFATHAYPPHTHHGGEDCVVLSGAIRDHSGVHKRGDYVFYGPNTEHLDLKALEGEECVIFVAAHGGVEYHA